MAPFCAPIANRVVESDTFDGLSALTLRAALGAPGKVVTFDVAPWRGFAESALRMEDFIDGRLREIIADLARPEAMAASAEVLARAGRRPRPREGERRALAGTKGTKAQGTPTEAISPDCGFEAAPSSSADTHHAR